MADRRVGLRALMPYLRRHRGTLIIVGVLSLLAAGASLVQPVLVRSVLDGVQAGTSPAGPVALLIGLLLTGVALRGVRDYLLQRTAEGVVLTTRRRLAAHLLRLPIAEYDRRRTGDLLSRVGADSTLLRAVVTSGLFEIVTGVVMVAGALVAMALLDPLLLAVALAGLAVGLTVAITVSRRVRGLSEQAQARLGEMTSAVERAISAARTIRASRAEGRETAAVDRSAVEAYEAGMRLARLEAVVGPASDVAIQGAFLLVLGVGGARVASGAIGVGDLVAFILFLFFLAMPLGQALHAYTQLQTGLGALQRIEDILEVPDETAYDLARAPAGTTAHNPASIPARTTAHNPASIPTGRTPHDLAPVPNGAKGRGEPSTGHGVAPVPNGATGRGEPSTGHGVAPVPNGATGRGEPSTGHGVAPVRDTATGRGEPSTGHGMAAPVSERQMRRGGAVRRTRNAVGAPAVAFAEVDFAYPDGQPVLVDVSFDVRAGERIALVGPSGAGKSTTLALIERFYDVTGGRVEVGGTDVRDLDRDSLRAQLGYVEQEAPVLAGTLRDNLLLTRPAATDAELLAALAEVNLEALAGRTADGLDVQVGEGGVLLSGGERQRLAIARALLTDAPILLLDEPTSNLDARNEAALRTAIAAASARRTLIVVAHRLSTVVDSDRIVVLDGGRVVAIGPHEELLETDPLYRELATHQLLVS